MNQLELLKENLEKTTSWLDEKYPLSQERQEFLAKQKAEFDAKQKALQLEKQKARQRKLARQKRELESSYL